MASLTLIRHAETIWNRERRMQGQTDTPLSDVGRMQAAALGERLAKESFVALYSSDLTRAWDTAHAIAQRTGHDVIAAPELRERRFGVFEGLTHAEIAERHPEELQRFQSRDPDYVVPGGECAREFHARCLGLLVKMCRGDRETAEDLLGRALYKAYLALARMEEPCRSLPAWLYTVAARTSSLRELRAMNLTEADLARRGSHPALGPVTLAQLLATWTAHDLHHTRQVCMAMCNQYAQAVGPWRAYINTMR